MKIIIGILCLVLYTIRTEIVEAQKAAIELEPMNILYIGIKTPVRIVTEGKTSYQIITKTSTGGFITNENNRYFLTADGQNRIVTVKVGYKTIESDTAWVDSFEFRVRKLPEPEILFGFSRPGYISKNELATIRNINAGLGEGFAYKGMIFSVLSYNILCLDEQNFYIENHPGNQISYQCRKIFYKLHPGAIIIIRNIKVRNEKTKAETEINKYLTWHVLPDNEISIPTKIKITGFVLTHDVRMPISILLNGEVNSGYNDILQGTKTGEWNVYGINGDGQSIKWQTINFKNDSIIDLQTYYSNGNIKSEKINDYNSSTGKFTSFFKSGGIFLRGNFIINSFPRFYNIVDDTIFKKNSFSFINGSIKDTSYSNVDELLFGPWEQFYPNGNLKEKGAFDTTFENNWWIEDYISNSNIQDDHTICFAVRQGIWDLYDEKGNKTAIRYNKGHIVK